MSGTGASESSGGALAEGSGGALEQACCLAAAVCNAGDTQLDSEADCPEGVECYSNHICCDTVWCAPAPEFDTCDAVPTCGENYVPVSSCANSDNCYASELCGSTVYCEYETVPSCGGGPQCPPDTRLVDGCPGEGDCQTVSACGDTIYCLADVATCSPEEEPNRDYVTMGQDSCVGADIVCPAHTTLFENECGCGCEQGASCPESVDCQPTFGSVQPLCSSEECPYTTRLQ